MEFSDLRGGYLKMKFNTMWFWEHLKDDREEDFEITTDSQKRERQLEEILEQALQDTAYDYIESSVFENRKNKIHESIWDALYDTFLEWVSLYPGEVKKVSLSVEINEECKPDCSYQAKRIKEDCPACKDPGYPIYIPCSCGGGERGCGECYLEKNIIYQVRNQNVCMKH